MRVLAEKVLSFLHLRDFASKQLRNLRLAKRRVLGIDTRITNNYMSSAPIKKLQLGCGLNPLPGWLNSDLYSRNASVVHVDVTKRLPFDDETFDYVFSEHAIEHVDFSEGLSMLMESHRILKPGGKIRVSTPDLLFLVRLYGEDKSELQRGYIQWISERFIKYAPYDDAAFAINTMMRGHDHKFIYDEGVLRSSFDRAGFKKVRRCELNQSEDRELRNLENEGRMPPGYLKLESLILEGTKE